MSSTDFKLFNFFLLCIILLGLVSVFRNIQPVPYPSQNIHKPPRLEYIPQFILISFDGSRQNDIWKMIRDFKEEMRMTGKSIYVTHFINAAYLLVPEKKDLYQGPWQPRGVSNVGFSENMDSLRTRIREMNRAIARGDEIAIHTVGHFSGLTWSEQEWLHEINSFDSILFGLDTVYPEFGLPRLHLAPNDVVGFRAPYLEHSSALFQALHAIPRMKYDSSEVGRGNSWPKKDESGLWRIPLGMMKLGNERINILAMDYNLYMHDSQGQDLIRKGTSEWQKIYMDTLDAFRRYFDASYYGNRAPVLIGYHFETWNDGVYWETLKTFARETCGKPEVRCGTFKELVDYMEKYGVPVK